MKPILEAEHLSRTFRSPTQEIRAVDDMSFSVEEGEILAIVGLNGAGKTTLLRMCSTLLEPTSGTLCVDGIDAIAHPHQARRTIGLSFGGDRGFYPKASVKENLLFFADLARIPGRELNREVARVLSLVDLKEKASAEARTLSRGQYQRLHIARALLGNPKLVILDEPTNGLDPNVALRLRSLIASIATTGTAILLSSHSMEEVSELATRILLMRSSRIIAQGHIADVVTTAGLVQVSETILSADAIIPTEALISIEGLAHLHRRPNGSKWMLTAYWTAFSAQTDDTYRQVLSANQPGILASHRHRDADLQDAFLFLSREDTQ